MKKAFDRIRCESKNKETTVAAERSRGLDMETFAMSGNPTFLKIIQSSRERYRKEGGASAQAVRDRLKGRRKPRQ